MTTHFPHGVGTLTGESIYRDVTVPFPVNPLVFFEDFTRWPVGGLSAAQAAGFSEYSFNEVTAQPCDVVVLSTHPDPTGSGGRVRMETNVVTAANDRFGFGAFQFVEMEDFNQVWFETLINQRTDSDQISWIFGINDTINEISPNDGVHFSRSVGSTDIEILLRVDGATEFQATVLENFVNGQDYSLAYHYDQQTTLDWEVKSIDGLVERGTTDVSNIPPPDQAMRPKGSLFSNDTVQKQIDVDYFLVISDIQRLGSAG